MLRFSRALDPFMWKSHHVKKGDVIARMEQTQLIQANEQLQNARSTFQRDG
jgi:multidrug resistance efflux pump